MVYFIFALPIIAWIREYILKIWNKRKYSYQFQDFFITNRWNKYHRGSDFVLVGISKRWFSHAEFGWCIHVFGIDFSFWFRRELIKR